MAPAEVAAPAAAGPAVGATAAGADMLPSAAAAGAATSGVVAAGVEAAALLPPGEVTRSAPALFLLAEKLVMLGVMLLLARLCCRSDRYLNCRKLLR